MRRPFKDELKIRNAIADYVGEHGVVSLRAVAKAVKKETGFDVPAMTIRRLLSHLSYSYVRDGASWVKTP